MIQDSTPTTSLVDIKRLSQEVYIECSNADAPDLKRVRRLLDMGADPNWTADVGLFSVCVFFHSVVFLDMKGIEEWRFFSIKGVLSCAKMSWGHIDIFCSHV